MATKVVSSVVLSTDGKTAVITYNDGTKATKTAANATQEINQAKLGGHFTQQSANPTATSGGIPAFGTTGATGGGTNSTTPVKVSDVATKDNYASLYQLAGSSKSDGFAKIRSMLISAGVISKGTRSLASIQSAWDSVLQGAIGDNLDPATYLNNIKKQGIGLDTATTQGPTDYSQITVWDPTKTKDYITQLFIDLVHREPTAGEIADYGAQLKDAQKKNASKTSYTKDSKGKTVATTTGGLDEQQFITDLIKKNPDYIKGKESATGAALAKVREVALANGLTMSDADLAKYAEQVRNGEPVEQVGSIFRKIAGVSQPKYVQELLNSGVDLATIYQPYKSAMASTLEIDPNTIKLSDPALSNAITGEKTLTSSEFQRALRKDSRWQYTNNAREEAASAATQILKDFGFMG